MNNLKLVELLFGLESFIILLFTAHFFLSKKINRLSVCVCVWGVIVCFIEWSIIIIDDVTILCCRIVLLCYWNQRQKLIEYKKKRKEIAMINNSTCVCICFIMWMECALIYYEYKMMKLLPCTFFFVCQEKDVCVRADRFFIFKKRALKITANRWNTWPIHYADSNHRWCQIPM